MGSLIFIKHVNFLFVLLELFIVKGGVYWEMKTSPARFGKNVDLLCQDKNNPSIEFQKQWYGGVDHRLLCTNKVSSNDEKYICKDGRRDDHDFLTLTIGNLSTGDVNIPYKCLFGFRSYERVLELNDTKFEYQPKEPLPTLATVHSCTNIDLKFKFAMVFPVPICSGTYGSKNLTDEIHVKSTAFDKLYRSNITMMLNSEVDNEGISNRLLSIKCIIGSQEHTLVNQHISCYGKDTDTSNENLTTSIVMPLLAVILLIVVVVMVLKKYAFNCNTAHGDTPSENLATAVGSNASIVSSIVEKSVKKLSSVISGQKNKTDSTVNKEESQALQNKESNDCNV